jgi:phosphoadenylyl-sulfate reductase (thioredoxin)
VDDRGAPRGAWNVITEGREGGSAGIFRPTGEMRTGEAVDGVWKVQPLADWTEKDVWRYIVANDIPYNPLHDVGYRSIGCIPCTRPARPDEEERAGRWAGSDKLECGLHVEAFASQ